MIQFLEFIKHLFLFFYLLLSITAIISAFNKKSILHRIPEKNQLNIFSFRMLFFAIVYFICTPLFMILSFFVNVYKILLDDEE